MVPEAVAFALIACLSPLNGLYDAFVMGIVKSIFGGRLGMISCATGCFSCDDDFRWWYHSAFARKIIRRVWNPSILHHCGGLLRIFTLFAILVKGILKKQGINIDDIEMSNEGH